MTALLRRVGGPNALTWPSFWMALLVSLALNLPDQGTDDALSALPRNLLANLVAVLAMFAVMLALRAVFLRHAGLRPRPGRTLAMFVVGAATRAVVLGILLDALGTGEPAFAFRITASVLAFPVTLAVTAVAVDLIRTASARQMTFRDEAARLQAEESGARARARDVQEQALVRVRDLLLERLAAVQGPMPHDTSARLRADAEQVIRPLSHQLAGGVPGEPAPVPREVGRITWSDVWQAASLGRPFRPVLMGTIAAVGSVTGFTAHNDSFARGVAYAVMAGLFVMVALAVIDRLLTPRLRSMSPRWRGVALITGAVVGMGAAVVGLVAIIIATGGVSPWRVPIGLLIGGPPVIVAIAVGQGLLRQVASADAELAAVKARLRHAAALAQAAAWHEERRVSRALHGPVQNAVVSAAMCIEAGDRDGAERLLIRALGHLDDDQRERGTGDALDDLVESWSGLCDVRVSVPAAIAQRIDADPPLASAVIDICTEACSNAVRHGGARGVSIQATDAGDAVALDITDDGAPTGISPDPGLGTAMLDGVALEWQREREGSRTVLSALLPWPGAPAADSHNPRRPCAPSSPNR
jgi:hypothetical protein